MTTPIPSHREALVSTLVAMLRIEWFMLLVWAMSLVYMILQDRADRQYAAERHREVMESLRGVPRGVVQQVRVEQRNGLFESALERVKRDDVRGIGAPEN